MTELTGAKLAAEATAEIMAEYNLTSEQWDTIPDYAQSILIELWVACAQEP